MLACTYVGKGRFALTEKEKPTLQHPQDAIVRVPLANQGLTRIPDGMSDEQALLVGDVLATGYWAAKISDVTEEDTVLIIGAGPTGLCTLLCVMLKTPRRIIVCESDPQRRNFVKKHYPGVLVCKPEEAEDFVLQNSDHGGADVVLEVAGCDCEETLRLIAQGKIDTAPLITHTFKLKDIEEAYDLFENRRDGVIKVAVKP